MKLSNSQITQIKEHVGADPVPADSAAANSLTRTFGDHTFYVDQSGLHVFEIAGVDETSGGDRVFPVRIASWTDDKKNSLSPHEPVVGRSGAVIRSED
jgi:hypothetical protein